MEPTEIRITEYGDETHESWVLIRANRVSTSPPGAALFDSDIRHHHSVIVEVTRCTRRRELNRDWLRNTEHLMRLQMSQAQWGAFVSSFGQGGGVPATLTWLAGEGDVPGAPFESRFDESHQEVREAGTRSLAEVQASYEKVLEAFEAGGKRALREALRDLGIRLKNGPLNTEFAAESLTEHVEGVVAKARADIEAMALAAAERQELARPADPLQIGDGRGLYERPPDAAP